MGTGCPKCGIRKAVEKRLNNLMYEQGAKTRNENQIIAKNTLELKFPEIAKEWHPTRNEGLFPSRVTPKSSKSVWWKCSSCKLEWRTKVASRVYGRGCPECAKHKRKESFKKYKLNTGSSLAEKFPEIAKEWNYDKNGDIKPKDVNYGSNDEYWWECELGHEWKTSVKSRTTKGTGCKYCNFELKTSFPEQAIFFYLNKVFQDVINSYQIEINNKKIEIDIFLPKFNLAIEYDGLFYHKKRKQQDEQKNQNLNSFNLDVIRVREEGLKKLHRFNGITLTSNIKDKENIKNIVRAIINYIKEIRSISQEELSKINNLI